MHSQTCVGALFGVAIMMTAAAGQEGSASALSFVPPDAIAAVRIAGPAALREHFAATGLAKAFASESMRPLWPRIVDLLVTLDPDEEDMGLFAVDEDATERDGERQRSHAARRELLQLLGSHFAQYAGDIVLGVRMHEDADAAADSDERLQTSLIVAFGDDGRTDLAPAFAAVEAFAERGGWSRREIQVLGEPMLVGDCGDLQLALPVRRNGCWVALLGRDLAADAAALLQPGTGVFPWREEVATAPIVGQLQFGAAMVRLIAAKPPRTEGDAQALRWLQRLGLSAIDSWSFGIRAVGTVVAQDLVLGMVPGEPRRLFEAMLPVRTQRPSLLQFVGASARGFTAIPIDVAAARRLFADVFAHGGDELPITREQLEARFTEFTKLRLHEDVLDHLGDEVMWIQDAPGTADLDDEDPLADARAEFDGACVVLRVRDGRTLAKNLDTLLRARGLHAARKREDYNGTTIYRLLLLGYPVEYAVTDSLLLVGLGGADRHLREVLDAVAARAAGHAVPEWPRDVAERLQTMPPDWTGLGVTSLVATLDSVLATFEQIKALFAEGELDLEAAPTMSLMADFLQALRGALVQHDLGTMVDTHRSTADAFFLRSRW